MGFRNNTWCSVFSVEPKTPTWTKCRINISKKNPNGDGYDTSFSGFVDFMGTACAAKAAALKPDATHPVRIRLREVDVDNKYDKERNIMYWNPKVWAFDLGDEDASAPQPSAPRPVVATGNEDFMQVPDEMDEEGLPW